MAEATTDAIEILEEALSDLDNPKTSTAAAVRKLARAAALCSEHAVEIWCKVQLGDHKYTRPLKRYIDARMDLQKHIEVIKQKDEGKSASKVEVAAVKDAEKELKAANEELVGLGITEEHRTIEELNFKYKERGGGYESIEFIERRIKDIEHKKHMNDGRYYLSPLTAHAAFVRRITHEKAAALHKKLKYVDTPITAFDVLKGAVEDRLLERFPVAAEKLMTAFVRVANPSAEEWSQALTSCRRFIEALADGLFPAQEAKVNGRDVGQAQYINRLWAFIDRSLESETDREMAKRHTEFLGFYLERAYKKTNQGVHAETDQRTAVICVFHCYLLAAAILDNIESKPTAAISTININSASLDDMEAILGISRKTAKEIVKLRVVRKLTEAILRSAPGMSPRTFERIKSMVRYEQ